MIALRKAPVFKFNKQVRVEDVNVGKRQVVLHFMFGPAYCSHHRSNQ